MAEKSNITENVIKFTKEQIVKAKTYSRYRDMLFAVLEDDRKYSKDEIEKIISKGGVC